MKPEKFFQLRDLDRTIVSTKEVMSEMAREDPGPPPGSERLSSQDRFEQMVDRARKFFPPTAENLSSTTPLHTPTLIVTLRDKSATVSLNYNEVFGALYALWGEPQEKEGYKWDEVMYRNEVGSSTSRERVLNNLEWSLTIYEQAAAQLTPEQAQELGFPEAVVEELRSQAPTIPK